MKKSRLNLKHTTGGNYFLFAVLTLAFAFGTSTSHAQCFTPVTFTPSTGEPNTSPTGGYPVGLNPHDITYGDFNGDGFIDIADNDGGGNTVTVYLNDGTGKFTKAPGSPFSVGGAFTPVGITTGDFNGDGKLDIVTGNTTANISVMFGNGDGTFSTATVLATSLTSTDGVATGDYNHDGITDIFAAGSGNAYVFLSNGDGTFKPVSTYTLPALASQGTIGLIGADLNGDGNIDYVLSGANAAVVNILYGNGTGGFGSSIRLSPVTTIGTAPLNVAPFQIGWVTAGDFNHDGILDIASNSRNRESMDVWIGNNTGGYNSPVEYIVTGCTGSNTSPSGLGGGTYAIISADLNGDGNLDIAITGDNGTSDAVFIFTGNGDGTFTFQNNIPLNGSPQSSQGLVYADFNGDGKPDLATANGTPQSNTSTNNTTMSVLLNTTSMASVSANTPVCPGGTIILTATEPGTITSYSWSGPNSFANSTASPTISSASGLNSGIYSVTMVTSGGCTGHASTLPVIVSAATASASATTLCSSATLKLTGGPIDMKTYAWSGPGGYTSSLQNPTVTSPAVGTGVYTLTVKDVNACTSSAGTASITVNGAVTASGVISGPALVCASQNVVYSTTIANAASYTWTVPGSLGTVAAGAGTSTITVTTASPSPSGTITVAGVSSGSCGTGPTSSLAVSLITSGPALAGNQTLTCVGSTTTLAPFTATGGAITTANGIRYNTYTSGSSTFVPNATGNVEVLVVAGGGGGSGGNYDGGGGGAGGLIDNTSYAVVANSAVGTSVGAGGAASGATSSGNRGVNSVFGTLTANGGGGGENQAGSAPTGTFGSGGGGGTGGNGTGTAGTAGQGFSGGNGSAGAPNYGCGGGGGGGGIGGTGTTLVPGNGGVGLQLAQFASVGGSPAGWFAGGGGGSEYGQGSTTVIVGGLGGQGGGGNGSSGLGANGVANTGGGGGASERGPGANTAQPGSQGGSGIIIVRYPDYSGGVWSSSNSAIASVDPVTGVVTANALGGPVNINYVWSPVGGGCSFTSQLAVSVAPLTVTATASPSPVCTSGTLTLTGSPTGATSYSWQGPNGFTSSLQSPTLTSATVPVPLSTASAGIYTLTVVSGTCTSSNTTTTVAVNAPAAAATAISGSAIACSNSVVTYSTAAIANAVSYLWTVPAGLGSITAGSGTNSVTVTMVASPVAGTITVAGVSASPCSNGAIASLPVTINTLTAAAATLSSPNGGALACPGQTGVIYSAAAIPNASSYKWTVPATVGTIVGTSTGQSITVTIAAPGAATGGNIIVAGVNLCGTVSTNTTTLAVGATPSTIIGNTSITCIGATSQLSPPATGIGGTLNNSGGFYFNTFTSTGASSFTSTINQNVEVLVVAGGGGGSGNYDGGGGGAGGLIDNPSYAVTALSAVGTTVGAGGTGGAAQSIGGGNGGASVFGTLTANGGGGGNNQNGAAPAGTHGSGGGGAEGSSNNTGGTGTVGQGNNGGNGTAAPGGGVYGGGGGGGAGAVGQAGTTSAPGNGGVGLQLTQFASVGGSPAGWFAGGGGGSAFNSGGATIVAGLGGQGGGGNGSTGAIATLPVANTGGGGGAAERSGAGNNTGSVGATGIVIVKYSANPAGLSGTWASDNTAVATVNSTGLVTGVSTGTANISFTPSGVSCIFTSSIPVTVSSSFNPTASATTNPVCTSGSLTLTATPSSVNYSWTGPNGFTSTLQSPSIATPTTAAAGIYSVTVSSGACVSSVTTSTVVINTPVTSAGTITGQAIVCASTSGIVYSTATIPNAVSYTWTVPTGASIVGAATNNSISVTFNSSPSAGNITVIGNSPPPCTTNSTYTATYPITVNTLTAASSGISTTNGAVICSSETGVIYSAAAIPNATSYAWTVPASVGTIIGASTNASVNVTTAASPTGGAITIAGVNACGTVGTTTSYNVSGPTPAPLSGTQSFTCVGATGQMSVPSATVSAGAVTTHAGGFVIQTFNATGTTNSTYTFTPSVSMTIDYLVVGGGGGGGNGPNAGNSGGGGAGGYRTTVGTVSGGGGPLESPLALPAGVPVTITVGGGGNQATGSASSIGAFVSANGGGQGGNWDNGSGSSGGSGGGGGQTGGGSSGGSGTANQGFAGAGDGSNYLGGAGAGGASAVGLPPTGTSNAEGGVGGAGVSNSISGSAVFYAGGGGGSSHGNGVLGVAGGASVGGNGGGGNGHYRNGGPTGPVVNATNGVDGTGGGGGGGGENTADGIGGAGVVIVRYPDLSGGTWSSSNTVVATVNSSGLVTTHANGTANINYTYTPANSTCSLMATLPITVAPLTASATATTPVCTSGSNSTLTLTPTTNAGTPAYSWSGPNDFTSTAQTPAILPITPPPFTLSTASAGVYTLTVTDASCGTGVTTTTNAVVVNPTVTTAGSIVGNPIVCSNSVVVYSTASIPNAVSYLWTVPGGLGSITSGTGTSSITVTMASSPVAGTITVAGLSAGGCDNGPTASLPVTVNTLTPASSGISSPNGGASVCPAQTGVIYSAVAIPSAVSYVWAVPASLGTIIGASTNNTITVTINGVGLATSGNITVAGVNLCGTTSTNIATLNVNVPATQVTGNTTITCLGATTQLTAPPATSATGGTITNAAGFTIHTFTSSGTFTPSTNMTVQYLVVAGGGGGGANGGAGNGGGGGAGGYRCSVPGETTGGGGTAEAPLALTAGTPYTVTVGAGGPGCPVNTNTPSTSQDGQNSVFGPITATGGGGGGSWYGAQNQVYNDGATGGSGGGAGQGNSGGSSGSAASPTQGFAGGNITPSSSNGGGAGGGGASVAGRAPFNDPACPSCTSDLEGGPGGNGLTSSITGTAVARAGGGGGASHGVATLGGIAGGACVGGTGGGGNGRYKTTLGVNTPATAGAANTGGGGGAGGDDNTVSGAAGGSGIVIVRYPVVATGTWSSDNTAIATVNSTGLVTAVAAGTCNILYTVTTGSCPYVNSTPLTVTPVVTPSATVAPPTCIGGTLALVGDAANLTATYSWSGPNTFTSTIQSPSINSLTTAAAGVYTLTVTKGACTESTVTGSIVVNSNPVPTITETDNSGTTNNDHVICNLDPVTLAASTFAGYSWSPGLATTQSITVTPSVSTTYTVTVTDGNGCTATTSSAVTVKALPPVAVNPQSAVCLPVTNIALTASGATGYTWAPSSNLTPSAGTSATETAQISLLTFYTVTGTDANQCSTQVIVPVATVATGGTITPLFSIICSGGTKALTVVGAAGHDYIWEMSTDNATWDTIPGATNTTYTTASVNGNTNKFYRLLARSNSCWNVASTTSEVDVSNPTIAVTASSITDNTLILNWSPAGTGNYSITYSGTSSGFQTGATPPKVITGLTANGTYSLVVTQTGIAGCSATGTVSATTLCAEPTNLTATPSTVGANQQLTVSWSGPAGNYRVYYRPLYSYITFFTQDVTNATTTVLKKQGANNLYASNTYQIYVASLDCPNTGNVGQPTSPIYVTTLPNPIVSCATPTIDTVFSSCPVLLEVKLEGGSGSYNVYIQRLTPTLQAVNSYSISSGDFVINALAGQQYLISADSKCGSVVSTLNIWHNQVAVKPICNAPGNLILSNPTCHGFTASWNADQCISNTISGYDFYMRQTGSINYNAYSVPLPQAGIGPHLIVSTIGQGKNMQAFVQSVYSCGGSITYGPSSQIATITTLSAGCRDEETTEQLQEDKPAVQQYSPDNQEVFSLYPNPNTGEFTVDLSRLNNKTDEVRIEVLNMIGQTVITQITSISDGHMRQFINLPTGTAVGTYIVRLTAGKNVYTAKMNISK